MSDTINRITNRPLSKIILILFLVFLIFMNSCDDNGTEPENKLSIKLEPATQTIGVDSTATFMAKIEGVSDLFSFTGEIVYNDSLVECIDVEKGSFWYGYESIFEHIVEEGRLNICVGLLQTDEYDGIDGPGTLFSFVLKGSQIGESTISFENLYLVEENSEPIDNIDSIQEGELIIE